MTRRALWTRWKRFAHRAAEIQSIVVLTGLYWVVVVPIGMLRGGRRVRASAPAWHRRPETGTVTMEHARRQS